MTSWLKKLFGPHPAPVTTPPVTVAPAQAATTVDASTAQRQQGNRFLDQGNLSAAVSCYRQAVALAPGSADAHTSLGFALQQLGQWAAAQAALAQALALQPSSFDAAYLLGQVHASLQQPDRAAAYFEQALALQPAFEPLYGELCQALFQAGAMQRARTTIETGLQRFPRNAQFQLFLGNLHFHHQETAAASQAYGAALRLDPALPQAHGNLATILQNQGDWRAAIVHFDKALGLDAQQAAFHTGRATCLLKLGQLDPALAGLLRALSITPDAADVHRNLGFVYMQLERSAESERHSRKALAIAPGDAAAHSNLGILQAAQGKFPESEMSFEVACTLDPSSALYRSNLGGSLVRQGRLPRAMACFRQARELDPLHIESGNNLLLALSADPATSPAEYLAEARSFGHSLSTVVGTPYSDWPAALGSATDCPLRVGFISSDLCLGAVGYFLEEVVVNTDPARIQLVAYDTRPHTDELSERIQPYFAQWNAVFGLPTYEIAQKIHADGIQILIDLNGHAGGNSLPVFALKPAPLQISWLGYWASTGLSAMDYVLADEASVPMDAQDQFTESVVYLPETRHCFTPPTLPLAVSVSPVAHNGCITFGSYQSLTKIHSGVLAVWARVLQAVPQSRLHLTSHQVSDAAFQQQFNAQLEAAGIDPSRVTLAGPLPRAQYLASYAQVDILLDTFPYTGGTTTCEALWMGVPTVTLRGHSMIARQGASMLGCVGLHDWIAEDEDDYVAKAAAHAADTAGLQALRLQLRDRALASPLFDAPRFAKAWVATLQSLWNKSQNK